MYNNIVYCIAEKRKVFAQFFHVHVHVPTLIGDIFECFCNTKVTGLGEIFVQQMVGSFVKMPTLYTCSLNRALSACFWDEW